MTLLKRLLSYIYPIKIAKSSSKRSGSLEVTLVNGKLVIDSKNTNYSYGSLQQVLKKGLLQIGENKLQSFNNILVLGVAGGSVIKTLRDDFNVTNKITGIEIDQEVINLANTYFKLNKITNIELKIMDAFKYIYTTKRTYDFVVIDIFNDSDMPKELFEKKFWNKIHNILDHNGIVVFNSIYTSKKEILRNKELSTKLDNLFKSKKQLKTHRINELFILEK